MTTYGVFYGSGRVGTLSAERQRLRFIYASDVAERGAPALSVRLPVRAEVFEHEETHAFFANLLPEDEYGALIARASGVSQRNVAGMLGAIGGECAGAVSIWPGNQRPPATPRYAPLDVVDLRRLLSAANPAERLALVREGRLSLAGTMEKLALRRSGDQWYRGLAGSPTTHILKWPQARFPDQNYNELFSLALCRAAGLEVPAAHVDDAGTPVLVIERYDRVVAGDVIALVHQEDICQAVGLGPAEKYQSEGGPGLAACARVIREHCAIPAPNLARLLRWALANYLIGNGDGHGKNLSLLHAADGVRLAPHYDLTSTLGYTGLSRKLAMAVGGEYRFAWVRARHWERLANELGITPAALRREGLASADRFEAALPGVREEMAGRYGHQPVFDTVASVASAQIARVRKSLTGQPAR